MVHGEGDPRSRRDHAIAIEPDQNIGNLLQEVWKEYAVPGTLAVVQDLETGKNEITDDTSAVLIDVSFNFANAITFIKDLRQDDATKDTPIVALTNYHGPEHQEPLDKLGVQILKTPTSIEEIGNVFLTIQNPKKDQYE